MTGRYPLEALQKVRKNASDEAAASLAKQMAHAQHISSKLQRAKAELLSHEETERAVTERERSRGERETLRASDLQQLARFQEAARKQRTRLASVVARLEQQVAHEADKEAGARHRLARVKTDERVIEKHRAGFEKQLANATDRRQDEAYSDHFFTRKG